MGILNRDLEWFFKTWIYDKMKRSNCIYAHESGHNQDNKPIVQLLTLLWIIAICHSQRVALHWSVAGYCNQYRTIVCLNCQSNFRRCFHLNLLFGWHQNSDTWQIIICNTKVTVSNKLRHSVAKYHSSFIYDSLYLSFEFHVVIRLNNLFWKLNLLNVIKCWTMHITSFVELNVLHTIECFS